MKVFSISNLRYVIELRGSYFSRLFYNKGTLLIGGLFDFLRIFSPKLYFANPFLFLLFPLWIFGLVKLISERNFKLFGVLLIFGLIGYKLPIQLIYYYISYRGLKFLISK